MARAKIKQQKVVPVIPVMEDYVELLLTPQEARVILQLVGRTCGDCPQVPTVYNVLSTLNLPAKTHQLVIEDRKMGMWAIDNPPTWEGTE